MTIVEALKRSKETGGAYTRNGSMWVKWKDEYCYKFDAQELIADDWTEIGEWRSNYDAT